MFTQISYLLRQDHSLGDVIISSFRHGLLGHAFGPNPYLPSQGMSFLAASPFRLSILLALLQIHRFEVEALTTLLGIFTNTGVYCHGVKSHELVDSMEMLGVSSFGSRSTKNQSIDWYYQGLEYLLLDSQLIY